MYWGANYDLKNQTLTRINRPSYLGDYAGARSDDYRYIATKNGYVEWGRIQRNEIFMNFISNNIEFSRWVSRDYSDRYMITLCKRFSDECMRYINEGF